MGNQYLNELPDCIRPRAEDVTPRHIIILNHFSTDNQLQIHQMQKLSVPCTIKVQKTIYLSLNIDRYTLKSIPSSAQYVTLHLEIEWRKVKICQFGSAKSFWPNIFAQFAEVGKRHSKAVHMPEKSVINMIWLLLLVSNWPIIMIGPGGLLLMVSHLFAVPILVLRVAKKVNN